MCGYKDCNLRTTLWGVPSWSPLPRGTSTTKETKNIRRLKMETEEDIEQTMLSKLDVKPTGSEENSYYGVFTPSEVAKLREDYIATGNKGDALLTIATKLFRHYGIRALSQLKNQDDDDKVRLYHKIESQFCNIQRMVVVKQVKKTKRVKHKKGDYKRDGNGNYIQRSDGSGYETYGEDEVEETEVVEYVPFWDDEHSTSANNDIKKKVEDITVNPDFSEMAKKLTSNTDFERGIELIREIAKYYKFEDEDKFANRFALLICNAKSKALNRHPKWPVLFSIVGRYGQGKSWFATKIQESYDRKFQTESQKTSFKRLLDSNFNSVMLTRGFVHFDEKNGIDSTQFEKLKTLITEPDVEVERKHRDPQKFRNFVTFISTTNESILDVVGLQEDRRILEFKLEGREGEIPEERMDAILDELWEVMPCEHPDPDAIIHERLVESKECLDSRVDEVVFELFDKYEQEFIPANRRYIQRERFKQVVKNHFPSMRFNSVLNWCMANDIICEEKKGRHLVVNRPVLVELMNRVRSMFYEPPPTSGEGGTTTLDEFEKELPKPSFTQLELPFEEVS